MVDESTFIVWRDEGDGWHPVITVHPTRLIDLEPLIVGMRACGWKWRLTFARKAA